MKNILFSLNGRVPRKTYWLFLVAITLLLVAGVAVDAMLAGDDGGGFPLMTTLLCIAIIWPSIAVTVKRWHDRGKSGWWMLINLVPAVGPIWAFVENGVLAGTPGQNRFGESPL
ncbi:MAG: DUF805 domain-containing protein [Magnetospirillum sp.]|nr:DUF805 domain-containing protein [Magnetospirillum sp.]